jgi:uncharacterized protein YrzB (UPF0473 family)
MADNEKDDLEYDEEPVVVMTDEEGNEYYYREEVIIPVGDKRFAILVPINIEEEGEAAEAACDCCDEEETDVYIARIDTDESGEEIYVDPSDEEFEEVRQAYEQLLADEECEG